MFHAPDLGILLKIADDVRRRSFIWEIPVESKSIYETFTPFQWGQEFYTVNPHDDLDQGQTP